ncbi:hypothetical protein [Natronoglycomyces albus]|uniref:DUF3137 domain-containing protein n=1 Tax=Natronoglycomyces albus TaxID=2811108 RepID=A0A895XQ81_9ACTN|nr:hypothetical protein [Natronoglycomyces albus]QSB05529.1 hypothetical protein JQS30_00880 [Natronoglycomyces albus]
MNLWDSIQVAIGIGCAAAFVLLVLAGLVFYIRDSLRRGGWRNELSEQAQRLPEFAAERGWRYLARDDRCIGIINVLRRSLDESTPPPPPPGPPHIARNAAEVHAAVRSGRAVYGTRFPCNPTTAAEHVMTFVENDQDFVLFQHRWNESTWTKDRADQWQFHWNEDPDKADYATTVALKLPRETPFVCVSKKGFGQKSALVDNNINLESHDFNRRYFVYFENRRFGYDIVNPSMIEWIDALDPEENDSFVVTGQWCFITIPDIMRAEEIEDHLHRLREFAAHIPDHVWSVDYGTER